jgi:hypothetical protein
MAVLFQKNMRNGFLNTAYMAVGGPNTTLAVAGYPIGSSATFYAGVQPTAADFIADWSTTYISSMLLHFNDANVQQPNAITIDTGIVLVNYGTPVSTAAVATGTTTWCVQWFANYGAPPTLAELISNGGPAAYEKFIITPVSNTSGSAPVRFTDTALVSGTSYTLADISVTAAGGIA